MRKPAVVAHCDWSKQKEKRWMAIAVRLGQQWAIQVPERVGETASLIERLQLRGEESGSLLVGFDFPIGLPVRYARQLRGLNDFRHALSEFSRGEWSHWYDVADRPTEISFYRPFYPMRSRGTRLGQLLKALHVDDKDALLRRCERATDHRKAACILFWTVGAKQVGKAAICGWREVVAPNRDKLGLWPFDGPLADLLQTSRIIVAETYPGDVYGQLRLPKFAKSAVLGRRSVACCLTNWLSTRPVIVGENLNGIVKGGFEGPRGEDQFDAMVGLFGMLDVVEGRREEGAPNTSDIRKWEGWILGQTAEQETFTSGNT